MVNFLIALVIIICVLMVFVVLAQNPKGSGLSSQFGGGGATQLMGAKRTSDFLERITWGMCVAVFLLCFGVNTILNNQRSNQPSEAGSPNYGNVNGAQEAPILPQEGEGEASDIVVPTEAEEEAPAGGN
ncbi:MAG: preprotein translocase subunit SecG [Bacteroidota bacterium]